MDLLLSAYNSGTDSDENDPDEKQQLKQSIDGKSANEVETQEKDEERNHGLKRKHNDIGKKGGEEDEDDREEGEVILDDEDKKDEETKSLKWRKLEPKVMISKNSAPFVNSVLKTSFKKATNNSKTHTQNKPSPDTKITDNLFPPFPPLEEFPN